jgi:hypothetical protein
MDFYRRELCAAKNIYGRNSNSKPSDSDTMMEGPYLPVQLLSDDIERMRKHFYQIQTIYPVLFHDNELG